MIVKNVMTPNPITVREEDSLVTAAERMIEGDFRRLPVVDQHGRLVGILSEHDISRAVGAPDLEPDDLTEAGLTEKQVRAYMTPDPVVVAPSTSVVRAAKLIRQYNVGGLPVTHRDKLIGIVVESDVLDYFIEMAERGVIGDQD